MTVVRRKPVGLDLTQILSHIELYLQAAYFRHFSSYCTKVYMIAVVTVVWRKPVSLDLTKKTNYKSWISVISQVTVPGTKFQK